MTRALLLLALWLVSVGAAAQSQHWGSLEQGESFNVTAHTGGPPTNFYSVYLVRSDWSSVLLDEGSDPRETLACPLSPHWAAGEFAFCEFFFEWQAEEPQPEGFDPSSVPHMLQALFALGLVALAWHGWSQGSRP